MQKNAKYFDIERAIRLLPDPIQWEIHKLFLKYSNNWNDSIQSNEDLIGAINELLKDFN